MKSKTLCHIILAIMMAMAVTGHEVHPTDDTRELEDGQMEWIDGVHYDYVYYPDLNPYKSPESGDRAGRERLRSEWREMGSDCSNAFKIRKIAKELIRKLYKPRSGDNWKRRAYKEAAAEGMKQAARSYEKQCLGGGVGGIDECEALGDAAVYLLAQEYCGISAGMDMKGPRPNYRKMCVNAAVDICKGNVSSKVRGLCGEKLNHRRHKRLQDKCRRTVKDLVN